MAGRFTQYGGALGAEQALREMVASRIAAEMEARKRAVEDYKIRQDDQRIGQGDRRMDIDVDQFGQTHGLNVEKHTEDVRQFDAQAPERDARTGYIRTQTRDLEQKPMYQAADRAHDETMARLGHGFRLGQINRQGEIDAGLINQRQQPPAGSGATGASYSTQKADDIINSIDDLLGKHGPDGARQRGRIGWTTAGPVGALLSNVGGTEAANVSADLGTVAANIAFGALQEMREASKTGGALGAISDRELSLLADVEGSIRQNQSPANLRKNLEKIYQSRQRFLAAKGGMAQPQSSHAAGPAMVQEFDWVDGKLVPRGAR